MASEIIVLPFPSHGHTFPATELCRRLASHGHRITIFLPPSSSSSQLLHPMITVVESSPPPPPPPHSQHHANTSTLENYLTDKGKETPSSSPVVCAIVDVMMSHLIETCRRHGVPVVSFFTSSACSAALEHGARKLPLQDMDLDDTVVIPGLPDGLGLTVLDLIHSDKPPMSPPRSPPPSFSAGYLSESGRGFHGPEGYPPPPGPPPPGPRPPPLDFGQPLDVGHGLGSSPTLLPPPLDGGHGFHGPKGYPPPPGPPPPGPPPPGPPPGPPPPPLDFGQPLDAGHGLGSHQTQPPPRLDGGQGADVAPLSTSQLGQGPHGPGGPGRGHGPRGIGETDGAVALIFNTCDDLERPFLEYISNETNKPVWGVGPLLPDGLLESLGSPVHDQAVRSKRESSVTEAEVLKWLDSKPPGSVLYISFGTMECPSQVELVELAIALEESDTSFIWVLQTGPNNTATDPFGSSSRVKERGLVIRGWAPQLLILSHPSTGGFLSHCGWNSTVEAMACGVPMLTWPVKGDQFHNEKLVVNQLKVGRSIRAANSSKPVVKDDVRAGIEELMEDKEIEARAVCVRSLFTCGFPESSSGSLQSLLDHFHLE